MAHNLNSPPRPPRPQITPNIKPTSIRPILSPVSINNTILIKQPLLPNTITTDKIIPIITPNLINLPPPKPVIQPKQIPSETQYLILGKQPILPNSSTPTTISTTNNSLMFIIIGALVVGFVILKIRIWFNYFL